MKILAVEFSSTQRSVAVVSGDGRERAAVASEVVETGGRSIRALGMIEEALRQAGLEREQIECLAVGRGPGSYAGIRAAIALAQGWQLARPVKVLGLSSAEALATQASAQGMPGRVAVVIDAQRNEFYLASYELNRGAWRELQPLRLASLADVQQRQQAGEVLLGPELARWFPAGRELFPRAAALGEMAAGRTGFIPAQDLEPIYLRATTFVKAKVFSSSL